MKKLAFPSLILILVFTLGFVYKKYERAKDETPVLKERNNNISLSSEWLNNKEAMQGLIDKIRRHPEELKAKTQLAMAYIQEGRITGDHAYYDDATLKLINQVLEKEPNNYDALCVKATVLLSQHHFSDALVVAKEISAKNLDSAFPYGLLCDAYVELGNYQEAVNAADKMISIRPDLRSYSRIAYLREIHGNYDGAKEAMLLAVKSGVAGLEQTEWCRTQLGKLHEMTGDTATASQYYQMALSARPNYAYASAGLARLAALKGNYTEGVSYLEDAIKNVKDPAFYEELSDMYILQNQRIKSEEAAKTVITLLGGNHNNTTEHLQNDKSTEHGHYSAKELAEASLKIGDLSHAVNYALFEYKNRPNNIDINELMAWVYFKNGEDAKALPFIEKALSTGSQKATLLWKAGNILLKNNQKEKGEALIKKALKTNKNLQPELI
jgi:tetratricopeptide (TPR) repeat protein